jgi:hypothetical protein
VRHRRALVLAVLVYVTLDLSLAGMPGAFVFEPADSAESTQVRARAAAETVVLPALARDSGSVLFQPPLPGDERPALITPAERCARPLVSWPSRAQYDPAPPSEDPH